ncbi:MAG: hypothetical protein CL727_07000 [Chloroflexi bacterium]|jgi:hypothetical protein|nr:hypothetical protein [Chloroflexota bacterium]|tara:strand:- start:54 stop:653 length:600 start_codon:yes stop_codon:yes gene_type:complete
MIMANKNTEKGLGSKGLRAYSPGAEVKYIGIRAGSSKTFYLNEVLDQMLLMALQKEYRNEQELEALLKLSGHINALRLSFKLTATKEDMARYYMMAQKNRYDKKFGLSKPDAAARFLTGKQPRAVSRIRPGEFKAKPDTPYYPRPGSSRGKVKVIMSGAVNTVRTFDKFIRALFSLQPGKGRKAHMPSLERTITKTFDV